VTGTKPAPASRLKLHRGSSRGEVSISNAAAEVVRNLKLDPVGTFDAKNTLSIGVPVNSASSGRGGARNRRDRISLHLTGAQVANLIAATGFALEIGLPLNRMITVHWQAAGVPLERMASATGKFLDLASKAIARRGGSTAWIFVHEGGLTKGGHCHILIHIPLDTMNYFVRVQKRWLKSITGTPYRKRVIYGASIGGRRGVELGNPELYAENMGHALSYVVKGTCTDVAEVLGLARVEDGGLVIGKRCGTSQNIGRKARQLAAIR
jgi:hypothetical protein